MNQTTQSMLGWADLLTREYATKIATLVLAVWLHASNSMLTSTTMPSAVSDIGGLNLLHWTFSLYLIGSIIAGASVGLLVVKSDIRTTMIQSALVYAVGSVIVALAPTMPVVLIGRILQGLGGGGLMGLVYIAQSRFFPNPICAENNCLHVLHLDDGGILRANDRWCFCNLGSLAYGLLGIWCPGFVFDYCD